MTSVTYAPIGAFATPSHLSVGTFSALCQKSLAGVLINKPTRHFAK